MNPSSVRVWGQVVIGILVMLMFLAVLAVVYRMKDVQLISAMVGYVAGFASAVVGYYYGSSASSQAKDEKLSPPPPTPHP